MKGAGQCKRSRTQPHTPPHFPHPHKHDTTQTQRWARQYEGEQDNTKVPNRSEDRTSPPPAIQQDHRQTTRGTPILNEGTPARRREGQHHSTRPSLTMPPRLVMLPHYPRRHPLHHDEGGSRRRTPHHTKEYGQTRTHTHHLTRQVTVHDTTAVLTHTPRWSAGQAIRTGLGRSTAAHPTAIPYTTHRGEMDAIHSSAHVHTTNEQQ